MSPKRRQLEKKLLSILPSSATDQEKEAAGLLADDLIDLHQELKEIEKAIQEIERATRAEDIDKLYELHGSLSQLRWHGKHGYKHLEIFLNALED